MTIDFVRQLTCNHAGYEALLLPLTLSPETPPSDILFCQCLAALNAIKVRPQLPHAYWYMAPCCTCLMSACNLNATYALLSSVFLASLIGLSRARSAETCSQVAAASMHGWTRW